MNSLLRPFTRLKLTPRLVEPIRAPVRPLSVSAGLEYYAGGKYHRIEGFSSGGRTPWRNGYGMMTKEFKFNKVHSPTAVRIKEFKRNPQLTRSVEDIPMFWMLRPLGEGETDLKSGEVVKDSDNVEIWKKNTWKRGMEHPQQKIEDGPTYRFKHWTAQKASRRRRLQLQYDIHLNRLRALYKVSKVPNGTRGPTGTVLTWHFLEWSFAKNISESSAGADVDVKLWPLQSPQKRRTRISCVSDSRQTRRGNSASVGHQAATDETFNRLRRRSLWGTMGFLLSKGTGLNTTGHDSSDIWYIEMTHFSIFSILRLASRSEYWECCDMSHHMSHFISRIIWLILFILFHNCVTITFRFTNIVLN